ncbi:MAG: 50S ribosomal protein L6 [Nitrospinae bacterium]|nr:50S ribosomal protein L6 [Nitrospinota bacterium]
MSRIGKKPVEIPQGVDVKIDGANVTVKGKLGQISRAFHPNIHVSVEGGKINVARPDDERQNRALHGLTRSLLNNMVTGVTTGFERQLVIEGVGYRVAQKGKGLEFSLGYSHTINMEPPDGITFAVAKPTELSVKGVDKETVGLVAANIRGLREPEPYKGKGIRYAEERIRRKAGKTASK